MKIRLDYGTQGLEVEVPDKNLAHLLMIRTLPPLDDPIEATWDALKTPLGTGSLAEIARGRQNACVVLSDFTRPVPNKVILPPILETLEDAGMLSEEILILIATGLHGPTEGETLCEVLGSDICEKYRVENHNGLDREGHSKVATLDGVDVLIDQRYLKSDLKILTGLIEPHLMAGFSGGRKLVLPGLAHADTIRYFHSPRMLEHPLATTGVLNGNPLHEASLEAAQSAGVDFTVNVTLDKERRLTGVFAGGLEEAHQAGVRVVERAARHWLEEPVDIVLTSSAGHPLDGSFYQSIKGVVAAYGIVKEGGTIILAAECAQGLGSPHFAAGFDRFNSREEFEETLWDPEKSFIDQWQIEEYAKVLRKAEVSVFSDGVNPQTWKKCWADPLSSVEQGIKAALSRHGPAARIAILPQGPYVMASLHPEVVFV